MLLPCELIQRVLTKCLLYYPQAKPDQCFKLATFNSKLVLYIFSKYIDSNDYTHSLERKILQIIHYTIIDFIYSKRN